MRRQQKWREHHKTLSYFTGTSAVWLKSWRDLILTWKNKEDYKATLESIDKYLDFLQSYRVFVNNPNRNTYVRMGSKLFDLSVEDVTRIKYHITGDP